MKIKDFIYNNYSKTNEVDNILSIYCKKCRLNLKFTNRFKTVFGYKRPNLVIDSIFF